MIALSHVAQADNDEMSLLRRVGAVGARAPKATLIPIDHGLYLLRVFGLAAAALRIEAALQHLVYVRPRHMNAGSQQALVSLVTDNTMLAGVDATAGNITNPTGASSGASIGSVSQLLSFDDDDAGVADDCSSAGNVSASDNIYHNDSDHNFASAFGSGGGYNTTAGANANVRSRLNASFSMYNSTLFSPRGSGPSAAATNNNSTNSSPSGLGHSLGAARSNNSMNVNINSAANKDASMLYRASTPTNAGVYAVPNTQNVNAIANSNSSASAAVVGGTVSVAGPGQARARGRKRGGRRPSAAVPYGHFHGIGGLVGAEAAAAAAEVNALYIQEQRYTLDIYIYDGVTDATAMLSTFLTLARQANARAVPMSPAKEYASGSATAHSVTELKLAMGSWIKPGLRFDATSSAPNADTASNSSGTSASSSDAAANSAGGCATRFDASLSVLNQLCNQATASTNSSNLGTGVGPSISARPGNFTMPAEPQAQSTSLAVTTSASQQQPQSCGVMPRLPDFSMSFESRIEPSLGDIAFGGSCPSRRLEQHAVCTHMYSSNNNTDASGFTQAPPVKLEPIRVTPVIPLPHARKAASRTGQTQKGKLSLENEKVFNEWYSTHVRDQDHSTIYNSNSYMAPQQYGQSAPTHHSQHQWLGNAYYNNGQNVYANAGMSHLSAPTLPPIDPHLVLQFVPQQESQPRLALQSPQSELPAPLRQYQLSPPQHQQQSQAPLLTQNDGYINSHNQSAGLNVMLQRQQPFQLQHGFETQPVLSDYTELEPYANGLLPYKQVQQQQFRREQQPREQEVSCQQQRQQEHQHRLQSESKYCEDEYKQLRGDEIYVNSYTCADSSVPLGDRFSNSYTKESSTSSNGTNSALPTPRVKRPCNSSTSEHSENMPTFNGDNFIGLHAPANEVQPRGNGYTSLPILAGALLPPADRTCEYSSEAVRSTYVGINANEGQGSQSPGPLSNMYDNSNSTTAVALSSSLATPTNARNDTNYSSMNNNDSYHVQDIRSSIATPTVDLHVTNLFVTPEKTSSSGRPPGAPVRNAPYYAVTSNTLDSSPAFAFLSTPASHVELNAL